MRCSLLPVLLLGGLTSAAATVSEVWTFPLGTWIENLVERQNGQILGTTLTHPVVYQVDPTGKKAAVVAARIPHHASTLGIIETAKDVFYVNTGNLSITTGDFGSGSYAIYKVDLTKFNGKDPVTPTLAANFPKAGVLNGLTTLSAESGLLFAADSLNGIVWSLNVKTGAKKMLSDPLMKPKSMLGINGIKVRGSTLFWDNTDRGIVASAPISAAGALTGPGKVVAHAAGPDDFNLGAFDDDGGVPFGFIAGSDQIRQFRGSHVSVLSHAKLLAGSTASRLAKGIFSTGSVLYASTNGGAAQYNTGNYTSGGKIVMVEFP